MPNTYGKQLLDTWIDALITASKKVAHKAAEATSKFMGKKITSYKENNFSIRKGRLNIEWIETSIKKWSKCCDNKMDQSKWVIRWSIFYLREYKV